jgi:nucleoside-diphosphate kinase
MRGKITLSIIKPCAVSKNYCGQILSMFNEAGFKIIALKLLKLEKEKAELFYEVHKSRSFYQHLVGFMTSGPVIAIILYKDNAVEDFRKLIGATNPAEAEKGTVRQLYGESVERNAVHGSDSDENAIRESFFFFSENDRHYE